MNDHQKREEKDGQEFLIALLVEDFQGQNLVDALREIRGLATQSNGWDQATKDSFNTPPLDTKTSYSEKQSCKQTALCRHNPFG